MRKFIYIFCALLAYLVFSSRSCVPEAHREAMKKAQIKKEKQEIRDQFGSDRLSEETLIAFEEKARQKLIDLSDYLNIYFDDSMDESFRDLARLLIAELFINDSIHISKLLLQTKAMKSVSLKRFLNKRIATDYQPVYFVFDSILISNPLHRTRYGIYEGSITFNRQLIQLAIQGSPPPNDVRLEVDLISQKVPKVFGSDTIHTWCLFLGEVKQL